MNHCLAWICTMSWLWSGIVAAVSGEPQEFKPQKAGASSLEFREEVPVMILSGNPEAMGLAHGSFLKEQVKVLYQNFMQPASRMAGGMQSLQASAMKMEKHIPERFKEELKALAKASGLDYESLITGCAFPDVYRGGGCSTLAVLEEAAKGEKPLLARNLDFFTLTVLEKHGVVTVCKPDGFNSFVSITWPSLIGVLSGMNDKGLCCAVMEVRTGKRSNTGMPSIFLFRKVLEEAGSVEEGLELLKSAKRVASNNLMLIDASGAAAVAELGPGYFEVRKPEKGILFSTNHHCQGPSLNRSCPRFKRFEAFTQEHHGQLDVPLLQKALDVVNQGAITVQSMVFEPKTRKLHLSMGTLPASRGTYNTLCFEEDLKMNSSAGKAGDE